ncbi:hypothetical protein [Xanthomonas citri]|uniref:hypothetical protein n=1 Tax=Xanthomonas citri TaxID=346 RepID=UPI000AF1F326|nr:hypothetical protein [Xanthomonas citri]QTK36132.1 hypothetical protein XcgCFBP2526_08055 [Xanthomonas citri pv. glycines CFBP 2526]UIX76545.1 hypothetical protein LMJ37_02800 [Xanthomonas citri pv. glycines]
MLSIYPSLNLGWEAWSAIGSLVSGVGTFAAAAIALWIWRSDRESKNRDKEADSRALARLLLSEIQTICSLAHALHEALPTQEQLGEVVSRSVMEPKLLAHRLAIGKNLRTPRLERLSERLGILPAPATDSLALLMSSIYGLENMLKSLSAIDSTDAQSIAEVFDAIKSLYTDSLNTYIALARASGIREPHIKHVIEALKSIPSS